MSIPSYKNRVGMSVSGTPGTGPITLDAAESGRQSLASAYGANANIDIVVVDGTAWEVARDCTYTHSGTTVSRGTFEESSTGSPLSLTSAAKVYVTETANRIDAVLRAISSLTMSFRAPTAYRVWQGVCWWPEGRAVIATSDRDSSFTISNTVTVYSVSGEVLYELTSAYTGTDPGGAKMSLGSPAVIDGYLYVPCYNVNDGGSPLISRMLRFTIDPITYAVALDTGFGTSGAQSIGSDTAEHVAKINGEWWVCYHDQQFIRRFDASWSSLGTVTLSETFPANGGSQSMIWEDNDATVYIVMHGPNAFGSTKSNPIHRYTRSGTTLTYDSTLTSPGYGLSQGASASPLGYVWADRPGNRVWFTPDLVDRPLRAHAPIANQVDVYTPTLANSWVAFDATHNRTAKVYYDINTGRVWLEGMIKSGTTTNGTKLFNVPAYLRPKYSKNYATVSNDLFGAVGVVGNNASSGTAGDVVIRAGVNTWLSLDGVSWQVDDQ